ncbi:uncharacterized protein IL334_000246 [Kwoniella shivajii]|uniref:GAF domain-containing protein n=1 Tax=Kwoniella shivajii TaxID=564305 RepID=A0ABZ1CNM0_9TREE|nr:hypothetical protein IL334_000246 [Kwoniella shivajii]
MSSAPPTQISRPDVSGPNAPQFEEIAGKAQKSFGYVNFTVLQWIEERHALKRIYSSHPDDYPVGGEKIMTKGAPWPSTVVKARKPYASWNIEEIQSTYVDAPALIALGIHQTISVPVLDDQGNTVAALSFSGVKGQYTEETLKEMQTLAKEDGTQAFNEYLSTQ